MKVAGTLTFKFFVSRAREFAFKATLIDGFQLLLSVGHLGLIFGLELVSFLFVGGALTASGGTSGPIVGWAARLTFDGIPVLFLTLGGPVDVALGSLAFAGVSVTTIRAFGFGGGAPLLLGPLILLLGKRSTH